MRDESKQTRVTKQQQQQKTKCSRNVMTKNRKKESQNRSVHKRRYRIILFENFFSILFYLKNRKVVKFVDKKNGRLIIIKVIIIRKKIDSKMK